MTRSPQGAGLLSLVLSTGLLLVGPTADAAGGVSSPGGELAAQFADALTAQGWTRVEGADGHVIYRAPAVPELGTAPAFDTSEESLGDDLRLQLEAQGWVGTDVEDGSRIYHRPGVPQQTPAPSAVADGSPADDLRRQLEAQGWTEAPAEDGSLYFFPPPPPATSPMPPLAEGLRLQLEAHGWVGTAADDGSVVYRMPRAPDAAPAGEASYSLSEDLRGQLEAQGWTASPAADGSVYYLPPAPAASPMPMLADGLREQLEQQGWVGTVADDGRVIYRLPPARQAAPPAPADDPGRLQPPDDTLTPPVGGPEPVEGSASPPPGEMRQLTAVLPASAAADRSSGRRQSPAPVRWRPQHLQPWPASWQRPTPRLSWSGTGSWARPVHVSPPMSRYAWQPAVPHPPGHWGWPRSRGWPPTRPCHDR